MSYHQKLIPFFKKVVKHYFDDFNVHDKRDLNNYDGRALWCARETGTSLLIFDKPVDSRARLVDVGTMEHVANMNSHFVICEKGSVRKVGKDKAMAYIKQHYNPRSAGVFM